MDKTVAAIAAKETALKPKASKGVSRDDALTALARALGRGEPMPSSVTVAGRPIATRTFLAGFVRDQRLAWPSLAEHVENIERPTVGEAAAQLE